MSITQALFYWWLLFSGVGWVWVNYFFRSVIGRNTVTTMEGASGD